MRPVNSFNGERGRLMELKRREFLKLGAALLLPDLPVRHPRMRKVGERVPIDLSSGWPADRWWMPACDLCERFDVDNQIDSERGGVPLIPMWHVWEDETHWIICRDCILRPQPRPGVEVRLISYWGPCGEPDWGFHQAMEVSQGYETRFWRCPLWYPEDVIQIGGLWCWELDEDRPFDWNHQRLQGEYHPRPRRGQRKGITDDYTN